MCQVQSAMTKSNTSSTEMRVGSGVFASGLTSEAVKSPSRLEV